LPEPPQVATHRRISKAFSFPRDAGSIVAARQAVLDFIQPYCSAEQDEVDVFVALQEALANAVVHGCQNDPGKAVHCAVEIDPRAFTIIVRDPGPGFDVDAVTQSTEAGVNATTHGRGIRLMRSLMDDVAYRNGGSEVRLRKLRTAPPGVA
jgi:serine/threonine-protein kinase RsbW